MDIKQLFILEVARMIYIKKDSALQRMKLIITLCVLFTLSMNSSCASEVSSSSIEPFSPSNSSMITTSQTESDSEGTTSSFNPGTDLYGMISPDGNVVIEPKYAYLDFFTADAMARFQDAQTGLWGYIDSQGNEVIRAQYEEALSFSENLAAVKVDGLWGFINTNGTTSIAPQFEDVQEGFTYGRCVVNYDNKLGIIDRSGNFILHAQYDSIDVFCEKYNIVCQDGLYAVFDNEGVRKIDDSDSPICAIVSSGFYIIMDQDVADKTYQYPIYRDDRLVGYCDDYYFINDWNQLQDDSLMIVYMENMGNGLLDLSNGEFIIPAEYEKIEYTPGDIIAKLYQQGETSLVGAANVELGLMVLECKYGFIQEQYGYLIYTNENFMQGVVDSSGKEVLPPVYHAVVATPQGDFFADTKTGEGEIINRTGKVIKELPDIVLCDYYADSRVWTYLDKKEEPVEIPMISGFLNDEFEIVAEFRGMESSSSYISPIPYVDANEDIRVNEYRFISSAGYVDGEYTSITYYKYSGVIVVVDTEGLVGLLSSDGRILMKPHKCTILANEKLAINNNDSVGQSEAECMNYLVYTVESLYIN